MSHNECFNDMSNREFTERILIKPAYPVVDCFLILLPLGETRVKTQLEFAQGRERCRDEAMRVDTQVRAVWVLWRWDWPMRVSVLAELAGGRAVISIERTSCDNLTTVLEHRWTWLAWLRQSMDAVDLRCRPGVEIFWCLVDSPRLFLSGAVVRFQEGIVVAYDS